MTEVLLSGQLTMSTRVREFEENFAAYVGAPYAVMVNSGSSANLLATAVAANPRRSKHLKAGDEVLVPAVCWSTSVWPLIQMNLKPVLVDVDPRTLNIDVADLKRKISTRSRALMAVHVLGNCAPMDDVTAVVRAHDLLLIEDTCESLGSRWRGQVLGTLGDFGTYSFYFSHHMTTGEGGMVVCRTLEDYDLLKCLRAHGWSRELSNRAELERQHPDVDPRFLFVNVGYNLRPMEVQGALGLKQLARLDEMNAARVANAHGLIRQIKAHADWTNQLEFTVAPWGAEPVWFGLPVRLTDKSSSKLSSYLGALTRRGVEHRPIVSGNFARQPGLMSSDFSVDPATLPGAESINHRGLFIGLPGDLLSNERLLQLAEHLVTAFEH